MLVKLMSDQVTDMWETIEKVIDLSLPIVPGGIASRNSRILRALLLGSLTCWVIYQKKDNTNIIEGLVITRIMEDDISGVKSLLLVCGHVWSGPRKAIWDEGYEVLKKYGKANGCSRIIWYSESSGMFRLVEHLGAELLYYIVVTI